MDRDTFTKMMKNANYTLHGFEVKKPEMRLLNDDVALLAYEVHEDMTVDGKRLGIDAAETSVWTRRTESGFARSIRIVEGRSVREGQGRQDRAAGASDVLSQSSSRGMSTGCFTAHSIASGIASGASPFQ